MNEAIVGVGSNIDPERNVLRAQEILAAGHRLVAVSTFIWTAPVGFAEQPDFYNGAYLIATELDRDEFAAHLKHVEQRLGRVRTAIRSGPRTIDLDLVMWNGILVRTDGLAEAYVRAPVAELLRRHRGEGVSHGSTVQCDESVVAHARRDERRFHRISAMRRATITRRSHAAG